MRELVFRQWNEEWGRFYYWGINVKELIGEKYADIFKSPHLDSEFKESEQYTGRRDSKRTKEYPEGQMIFENDRVNFRNCSDEEFSEVEVGTIVFSSDYYGFAMSLDRKFSVEYPLCILSDFEVIGNVHEGIKDSE